MSVELRIPTILRNFTAGASAVEVEPVEPNLAAALAALEARYPGILARVLDDTGALRRFVNVYVDDQDVRFEQGLATPIKAGTTISIIPAVAGG